VRGRGLSAVVKVCTGTFVITVSNFVHCIFVDLTVVGENLAKNAFMSNMRWRINTGGGEVLIDAGGRCRAATGRWLTEGTFVDFKMGVASGDIVKGNIVCVRSADVCIAEGMYTMIIAEMEHINVIRKRLGDDEGIIGDGFNNDSVGRCRRRRERLRRFRGGGLGLMSWQESGHGMKRGTETRGFCGR
jgi:hypothetical protein